MKQGTKSNATGNLLEQAVQTILQTKGFETEMYRKWAKQPESLFPKEILLRNVPFETVYGHRGNTEFLLLSEKYGMKTRIECKWQQVSGSVDEKLPYLYLNCIEAMPENDIIILIDGEGWKDGAKQWLRDAVENKLYTTAKNQEKNIQVYSLVQFFKWANDTFV